jgi:NADPH:quinone reductase
MGEVKMRAAWYERQGAAREVLKVGEMDLPAVGAGEVTVRVHVSGVNPSDTKARAGWRNRPMPFQRVVPHQDGAGIIEGVGEGVSAARVGQRIWVYEAQRGRPFGTAAEFVIVPADKAIPLPPGISFEEGACLGVPAMTAHYCVFSDGPVTGKTVLVAGGAGAVGNAAVQWAKWGGATVITTVSSEAKTDAARAAGADHVLNYRREPVAERIADLTRAAGGVDRIVEVAFGLNLTLDLNVLKPNGVIATYASDAEHEPVVPVYELSAKNTTVRFVLVYAIDALAHCRAANDITACLASGKFRSRIAHRFPLEQIAEAHEAVESGQAIGNVIVRLMDGC